MLHASRAVCPSSSPIAFVLDGVSKQERDVTDSSNPKNAKRSDVDLEILEYN